MKPLPKTCLRKVRVRAGINEPVAVWWSTTEISRGVLRECRHRRTDTHLDSRALSLAHTAEKRHDEVMCLRAWVDRSPDLRHPQADPVVREHRESERELRPVERTGRFPDHDSIEAAITRRDICKKTRCLRSALPRQRAALSHVEVVNGEDS